MMVIRENERVRLISRGGHDYAKRYPWIVEAARANRHKHFAIDGEVVLLGVDGISDFDGLHSGKHNDEAQFYTFDMLSLDGADLRRLPLSLRKQNLARLLDRRPDGIFAAPFEQGEIGPDVPRRVQHGPGGLGLKAQRARLRRRPLFALDQGQEPRASSVRAGAGSILVAAPLSH
jgi:bifunctional non-homologous end joining protein LigD